MGRSVLIAALAVIALVLWMLSGQLGSKDNETDSQATSEPDNSTTKMKVQTRVVEAQSITREVIVQGQLEPLNIISVRAETEGNIESIFATKGQRIGRGQSIAKISIDTRNADLAVAKANMVQAENEFIAARKLQRQGLQSKFSLETATAKREAASAQVQSAELALANTDILAPLDALVEEVHVKQGDFVDRGATISTLVDNSQLLVTGQVPQQRVADVKIGQKAIAKLVTGQEIEGRVNYISSMADSARSFKVEVLIEQPPERTLTGISAQISIPVETLNAHRISPAVLSLDDNGSLGVKAVGPDNTVVFHKIEIVKTESNGAWVTGLPDNITLITLGQGFVNPGEEIIPVPATAREDDIEEDSQQSSNGHKTYPDTVQAQQDTRVAKL